MTYDSVLRFSSDIRLFFQAIRILKFPLPEIPSPEITVLRVL